MKVLMTIPAVPSAPFDDTVAEQEGWGLFDCGPNPDGTREVQLQRIDFPDAGKPPFDSDKAVWAHVVARARAGSDLHRAALAAADPVERALIEATFGAW